MIRVLHTFDSEANRFLTACLYAGTFYGCPGATLEEATEDLCENQLGCDVEDVTMIEVRFSQWETACEEEKNFDTRSDTFRALQSRLNESRRMLNGVRDENEFAAGWHEIERQQFALNYQNDPEWMAEVRREEGMLGNWDFENGHPY